MDKEADELVNAQKYKRSQERQGYRSGHYKRNFQTTTGEVEHKVPKLKGVLFETAIIERYCRRESFVEEALIEMYLVDVSVRSSLFMPENRLKKFNVYGKMKEVSRAYRRFI